jgi:hypothetical protein
MPVSPPACVHACVRLALATAPLSSPLLPPAACPARPCPLLACSEREKLQTDTMFETDNTGIDFDAYEDIPVEVR